MRRNYKVTNVTINGRTVYIVVLTRDIEPEEYKSIRACIVDHYNSNSVITVINEDVVTAWRNPDGTNGITYMADAPLHAALDAISWYELNSKPCDTVTCQHAP